MECEHWILTGLGLGHVQDERRSSKRSNAPTHERVAEPSARGSIRAKASMTRNIKVVNPAADACAFMRCQRVERAR